MSYCITPCICYILPLYQLNPVHLSVIPLDLTMNSPSCRGSCLSGLNTHAKGMEKAMANECCAWVGKVLTLVMASGMTVGIVVAQVLPGQNRGRIRNQGGHHLRKLGLKQVIRWQELMGLTQSQKPRYILMAAFTIRSSCTRSTVARWQPPFIHPS